VLQQRKFNSEELPGLYYSPSIFRVVNSRRLKWLGHVACMADKRNAYRILVRKPEGKRLLGRSRHGWDNDIKMYIRLLFCRCLHCDMQLRQWKLRTKLYAIS
jgi:hypothetical protein